MEDTFDVAPRRRQGGGVVEMKKPSKMLQVANKLVPALLAASAVTGAVGILNHASGAENDNGVRTELIPHTGTPPEETDQLENTHPEAAPTDHNFFDLIFHDLNDTQKAQAREEVDMFKGRILSKTGYEHEHLAMPMKYRVQIEQTAKAYGISENTLRGLVSIENGGGEDVTNKISGARGVAQFLESTGRQYGLTINSTTDERTNPGKSIAAAGSYLEQSKALFGNDEGIALWSYHAGVGNVYKALRAYFIDVNHVDIGDYSGAITANNPLARELIESDAKKLIAQDHLDVFKLLKNQAVHDKVLSGLDDYSDTYVFQIAALNEIMKEHASAVKE